MSIKAWSPEDEKLLIEKYTGGETDVYKLARFFKREGHRSVISKLVQLRIYNKPKPKSRQSLSIKEMIIELEELLDIEISGTNVGKKENLEAIVYGLRTALEVDK